ncbi:hypothetical protein [Tumebacillus flagellatus]|uniref:Uncharacterized protein n=1 Tax=Tumebacillus flagellatus TaxID=1157490 RepID=A0A074LRF3_9BACL|nr:hypothetical protein [Tumebacillus flagellatus]KEO84706.1 hypothetical protein EL26_04090 [Tumebacillus flagellatus]
MQEIYRFEDKKKIHTKNIAFYRMLRDKKVIDTMHQLFTYACLVGVKEDKRSEGPKPDDICTVGNIDVHNLQVVKGIVLMKSEPESSDELLKVIEEFADGGIEILMKEFDNEGTIRLDKYI